MGTRLGLDALIRKTLGSTNVYFKPPETIKLKYPCVIYHSDDGRPEYANNGMYKYMKSYTVTVIDPDPDSELPDKFRKALPYCRPGRWYAADNLNHWPFTIYY